MGSAPLFLGVDIFNETKAVVDSTTKVVLEDANLEVSRAYRLGVENTLQALQSIVGSYTDGFVVNLDIDTQEEFTYKDLVSKYGPDVFDRPSCYEPNSSPYPLCRGANTPQGLAENDCYRCCLYEDMKEDW